MTSNKRVIIIHPGVQHAYRLANALHKSKLFNEVRLLTWFLLKPHDIFSSFPFFKKRVKDINNEVKLYIFPLFELLLSFHEKIYFSIYSKKRNSNFNNLQYLWSTLFGYFLLPYLYFHKKNSILILYDTSAWPLSYYAKKWRIPVIMDFPSISHEDAMSLGISETQYGIDLKIKERQHIDYALFCSDFAKATYQNKTSANYNYTAHVGAEVLKSQEIKISHEDEVLHIAFIANMELRKGLDYLLAAIKDLAIPYKLHLIGKISTDWVLEKINPNLLRNDKICFAGPFNQEKLIEYLQNQNIQLHVLPSRFDSFGMVVPETMMLGIPNIVSPYVGAGEKIIHGTSGYIMKELSSAEISKHILAYYNLPLTDKIELSRQTYERSKLISWGQYDLRINGIFKEILSGIKPKIAFVVTHPTQFEAPFYQYIEKHQQEIDFEVIYIDTQNDLHYDKEIQRKIDWGFNLFEGYKFCILNKHHIRKEFKRKIANTKYDLIITNGYNGHYLKILDLLLFCPSSLALRIDSISSNQPFAWKWWKKPILSLFFTRFNYFLAVGSLSKKYLESLMVTENRIRYFSYSIDQQKFEKVDTNHSKLLEAKHQLHNKKVFLSVSKLVKREIPMDTIKAFIAANNPNWTLLIVGDGKDKNELIKYCNKYPEINIKFLGYIPYKELPAYYHVADVFIHSTLEENWGVSVQEATAANCSVITSDTVGSSYDLIDHGKNGYIYPYKDILALKKFMELSLQLDRVLKLETNQIKLRDWGYPKMWNEIKNILN